MVQIENTYFDLGRTCSRNCLIICDRGAMDASACKCIHTHNISTRRLRVTTRTHSDITITNVNTSSTNRIKSIIMTAVCVCVCVSDCVYRVGRPHQQNGECPTSAPEIYTYHTPQPTITILCENTYTYIYICIYNIRSFYLFAMVPVSPADVRCLTQTHTHTHPQPICTRRHIQGQVGITDDRQQLECRRVAGQSIQSNRAHGVGRQRRRGVLLDRSKSSDDAHGTFMWLFQSQHILLGFRANRTLLQSFYILNRRTPSISAQDHACRSEGVVMAKDLDYKSAASWVGHPYFDVIDNSTDFETKMNRMIDCVCQKLGIDTGDRLLQTSRKLKYLGTCSHRHFRFVRSIVRRLTPTKHQHHQRHRHRQPELPPGQSKCCPTPPSSPISPTSRWSITICSRSDRSCRRACASAARKATGRTSTRSDGRMSTINRWRCARS